MTLKTYLLYNGCDYEEEDTIFCVVDVERWPNFEALAVAASWTVIGEIDGQIRWRIAGKDTVQHVAQLGPVSVLVHWWVDDAIDSHDCGCSWPPPPPGLYYIDGVSANAMEERRHRHYSDALAAIATPAEAMEIYEGFRRRFQGYRRDEHGNCSGLWALYIDRFDSLLDRATRDDGRST